MAAAQASRASLLEAAGGLPVEHVHYDFPALIAETTEQGTFYSYGGQVQQDDSRPIEPRYSDPLATAVGEPHGAVLRSALGEELPDFDPVVDQAVWGIGSGGSEPAFDTPAWYPGTLLQLNQVGGQNELAIGLGQFHGLSKTQRLYGAMDVDIYSSNSDDWEPPQLLTVESELQGDVVVVTVKAKDPSGIEGVVVAYTYGGDWSSADLALSNGVWNGDFLGSTATEFFVQVVDRAGNVTAFTRSGQYMQPGDSYQPHAIFLPIVTK
jgi:hypothetical protein